MVRDLHFPPQRRVGLDEIVSFVSVPNRFGALDSICEDKSSIDVHGAFVYSFEGERVDDLVCDAALNDRAGLCTG